MDEVSYLDASSKNNYAVIGKPLQLCEIFETEECRNEKELSLPVRNIVDSVLYTSIKAAVWVRPSLAAKYAPLESILLTQDFFTPVFVNDYAPADVG